MKKQMLINLTNQYCTKDQQKWETGVGDRNINIDGKVDKPKNKKKKNNEQGGWVGGL